jgi:hypothetical protein
LCALLGTCETSFYAGMHHRFHCSCLWLPFLLTNCVQNLNSLAHTQWTVKFPKWLHAAYCVPLPDDFDFHHSTWIL